MVSVVSGSKVVCLKFGLGALKVIQATHFYLIRLREVESDESSGSSNWVLATRGVTVDWHARITAMESGQRIAWEATSGFPNRGEVRVFVLLTMGF